MLLVIIYLSIGLVAGVASGLVGIGGGILIVPALVIFLGFSQQMAQGTTLALMIPPIGLLAAWTYYKHGHIDYKVAAFICIGFFIGGLFGSKIAVALPTDILRKIFSISMIFIGIYTFLKK